LVFADFLFWWLVMPMFFVFGLVTSL